VPEGRRRRGGKVIPLRPARGHEVVLQPPRFEPLLAEQEQQAVELVASLFAAAARRRNTTLRRQESAYHCRAAEFAAGGDANATRATRRGRCVVTRGESQRSDRLVANFPLVEGRSNCPTKVVPAVWLGLFGLFALRLRSVMRSFGPLLKSSFPSRGPPGAPSARNASRTDSVAGANAGRSGKSRPNVVGLVATVALRAA